MRWIFMAVLWVALVGPVQAMSDADRLLMARLAGYEATSRLLLYFNPYLRDRELIQSDYRHHFYRLEDHLKPLESEDISRPLTAIHVQIESLEAMSEADESMLPAIINPLLSAQAEMDRQLIELAALAGERGPLPQLLADQALDMAKLSLWYQIRLFNGLMIFADEAGNDVLNDLDRTIEQRFVTIAAGRGGNPEFNNSLRHYQFIRGRILSPQDGWIPDAALLYLQESIKMILKSGS